MDLGTTNSAVTVLRGRKKAHLTFPRDGAQLPSMVYIGADGKRLVGTAAGNAACRDPAQLFTHFKRGMVQHPDEPWAGGPTPTELSKILLLHMWQVIQKVASDVKDYVPELGGTRDPGLLRIALSHPATYHLEAQASLRKAIDGVGNGFRVDTLISEPVAASFVFREEHGDRLHPGDRIAVCDVGGGTTDLTVLEFNRGVFDQVVGSKGDDELGGLNFTGVLFLDVAKELALPVAQAYDSQRGLALNKVSPESRRVAAELWTKIEEAKHALSVDETTTVYVQTENGLKEVTISRARAQSLWEDARLYERFEVALSDLVKDTPYRWSDIQHVMMVGGSALVPGLAERVAKISGRNLADVFLSGEPAHVVSDGAAFQARMQEKTALCLAGGLGITLRDGNDRSKNHHRFFIGTGEPVSLDGRPIEQLGQFLDSNGKPLTLRLQFVESKPGVNVPRPGDGVVLLSDDEVVPIASCTHSVTLRQGHHRVQAGFYHEPTGLCHYRITFPDDDRADVIDGILESAKGDSDNGQPLPAYDLMLLFDHSGSMSGEPLKAAQRALGHLINRVGSLDVRVALVTFGGHASLACPIGSHLTAVVEAAQRLQATGSTPMHQALAIAADHIRDTTTGRKVLVALFTDGQPDDVDKAFDESLKVKNVAELVTIGIGRMAAAHFLSDIASRPDGYYYGESFDQLDSIFDQIVDLYLDPQVTV
jgi:uncharacterized protein YegL